MRECCKSDCQQHADNGHRTAVEVTLPAHDPTIDWRMATITGESAASAWLMAAERNAVLARST